MVVITHLTLIIVVLVQYILHFHMHGGIMATTPDINQLVVNILLFNKIVDSLYKVHTVSAVEVDGAGISFLVFPLHFLLFTSYRLDRKSVV